MKSTRTILMAALAAIGLASAVPAMADRHGGGGHGYGGHGGHWGGHDYRGHGGHYGGWGGWSFYLGVPFYWPSYYYYGYPHYYAYPSYAYTYPYYGDRYYGYSYPEPYAVVPQDEDLGPTTEVQPGPGAPSQGPLYMNYCASAKAYYPKVTQCPEGWKFIAPTR
ncbi:MAG TPA: hypothetical protein VF038_17725 [Usitatibacter sp.]